MSLYSTWCRARPCATKNTKVRYRRYTNAPTSCLPHTQSAQSERERKLTHYSLVTMRLFAARPDQWQGACGAHGARRVSSGGVAFRCSTRLGQERADKLFAALREGARRAMRRGLTPASAVSYDRDPEVPSTASPTTSPG